MGIESVLGIALVPVRATLDQLDRDLEGARGKIDKAMGGIAGRIAGDYLNLGNKVAKGMVIASGALVGLGVTAAGVFSKLAIDALPLEQVSGAFAGITGNADAMLAKLREGSLGMVSNADLMKSYNSAAQLVGKTFADQLPAAMGFLSKVSAATGQDMGYMLDSLVKGVGRLSPMILDNLGIQVALSEATAEAAKMFGVEEDALTKAQTQAGMMNVVLRKLALNTAKMPEVAGSAAQKWASLRISMQNIKDRVGVSLIPIFERLITPLGALAERYLPLLGRVMDTRVIPVLDKLSRLVMGIPGLISAAGGDFDTLAGLLEGRFLKILDTLGVPTEKIKPFLDTIREIGSTLRRVAVEDVIPFAREHAPELQTALLTLGAFLASAAIVSTLAGIGGAIAGLFTPIGLIMTGTALLAVAWSKDWGGIQEKAATVWGELKPKLEQLKLWLDTHLPVAITTAKTFLTETLLTALQDVWAFVDVHVLPKIQEVVTWLQTNIPIATQGATDAFVAMQPTLAAVAKAFETIWGWIVDALEKLREWQEKNAEGAPSTMPNPHGLPSSPIPPVTNPHGIGMAQGGNFVVRRPTMFLAGERYQAERVVVEPMGEGQAGGGGGGYSFTYIDQGGGNASNARAMSRELEYRYRMEL